MSGAHRTRGLTVLWRGPLSGCNYDCGYCPFAKRKDTRKTLTIDKAQLERFTEWALSRAWPVSVLFTPWGEALIRRHYRDAIMRLSHGKNIGTVAIQTNLSCSLDWIAECDTQKAAFWVTYHPSQTERGRFLKRIERLQALGVRYSVGVVGSRAHFDEIEYLRAALPEGTYLWINAEEALKRRYLPSEVERLVAIDPLFELNNIAYRSKGRACAAGETVISVSGDGKARRCHFIDTPIGNIYDDGFEAALEPRACERAKCDCHIGYSHLRDLDMGAMFGEGFLERRATAPNREAARQALRAFSEDRD